MIIIEILRFLDIADDSVASEIVLVFSLIFAHLFFFFIFLCTGMGLHDSRFVAKSMAKCCITIPYFNSPRVKKLD